MKNKIKNFLIFLKNFLYEYFGVNNNQQKVINLESKISKIFKYCLFELFNYNINIFSGKFSKNFLLMFPLL